MEIKEGDLVITLKKVESIKAIVELKEGMTGVVTITNSEFNKARVYGVLIHGKEYYLFEDLQFNTILGVPVGKYLVSFENKTKICVDYEDGRGSIWAQYRKLFTENDLYNYRKDSNRQRVYQTLKISNKLN